MSILAAVSPFARTGYGFEVGFWIFISLFAAVSVAHLVFCYLMIPFWRKLTKPLCLVLLGAAMAFLVPEYPLVYVSCWLSTAGDLLLINNKVPKYFIAGAVVFAAAHTLNVISQSNLLSYGIPSYAWVLMAAVVLIAAALGNITHGKRDVAISTVCPAYACFHLFNIVFALMVVIDGKVVGYEFMILIGYLVYVVSDMIVNYVTAKRNINRRDFYVMSTYLCGQTLIYLGLALSLLA